MRFRISVLTAVALGMLAGCSMVEPPPQAVIHRYSYQAMPPATAGGIPAQPPGPPTPVAVLPLSPTAPAAAQTVYPAAPFGDPTVVIFRNESERATLSISVDSRPPMILLPATISTNINLGPGEHTVRWRGVVPTTHPEHPTLKSREQFMVIWVRAEDGTKVISLSER